MSSTQPTPLNDLPRCKLIDDDEQSVFPQSTKRFALLDVDNFKSYNTVFGYSVATGFLEELAVFLQELQKPTNSGIEEVIYAGGDEFVLCLNTDDVNKERAISSRLARTCPLPVTMAFASSFSRALRNLSAAKAARGPIKGGPFANRNLETHHIEIEIEYLDLECLDNDNRLKLDVAVTLHWKDKRLAKLPTYVPDTFPSKSRHPHILSTVWSPGLDIGDWAEGKRILARTLSYSWDELYALRADAIMETLWEKTSGELSASEREAGIKVGTRYVLERGRKPSDIWASAKDETWKDLGTNRRPEDCVNTDNLPLPREASAEDQTDIGFPIVAGFRERARKHMIGELHRSLSSTATIYFPFDYIEDSITFLPNSHERDLVLTWKNQKYRTGKSPPTFIFFNGFIFKLSHKTKKNFIYDVPNVHIIGWRNPRFYQIRFQLPLSILNLVTTMIFFFGSADVSAKAGVIVTAYVAYSSLLLVSSKFIRSGDGRLTIIDIQIIANVAFMVIFAGFSIGEWTSCLVVQNNLTFSVLEDPDEGCQTSPGLPLFVIFGTLMTLLNFVMMLNPWGLAVRWRFLIATMRFRFQLAMKRLSFTALAGPQCVEGLAEGSYECDCCDCQLKHSIDVRNKVLMIESRTHRDRNLRDCT